MAQLHASGIAENTIVIHTADHGFSLGHHGIWGHGPAAWPSSMRRPSYHVPLIINGPGIAHGQNDGLVSQLDLPDTMLQAAGARLIDTDRHDSRIITLGDPAAPTRDFLRIEQEETRAIRTADHLYVERFSHPSSDRLASEPYDLRADPQERTDISGRAEGARFEAGLSGRFYEYFARHAAPAFDLWSGGGALTNARGVVKLATGLGDGEGYAGVQVNWDQAVKTMTDGSADAFVLPSSFPDGRHAAAVASGGITMWSMPKAAFESDATQKYMKARGRAKSTFPCPRSSSRKASKWYLKMTGFAVSPPSAARLSARTWTRSLPTS